MYLSPYPPSNPPQLMGTPQAHARLIKHLPPHFSDAMLYDLCRLIASVRANQPGFPENTGIVEYYYEEDVRVAESAHCSEVGVTNKHPPLWGTHEDCSATVQPASRWCL